MDANISRVVSIHLLRMLKDEVEKLPQNRTIDHQTLIMGIAEMLGYIISELPSQVQWDIIPVVLRKITEHTEGEVFVFSNPDKMN
jgi:hypothetical protein